MNLLSEFLRSPGEFFQDERRQRILVISLSSVLFVCVLLVMVRNAAHRSSFSEDQDATPTLAIPSATNTKWWVKQKPSPTPTSIRNLQPSVSIPTVAAISKKCPAYAEDFKPGIYGYISLFPPYENLIRSGPGKNYSSVGYIEVGGWVKMLDFPVCADDGYVWVKVQSAGSSSSWTAGGRHDAQWIIPCSDPKMKCTKKKQTWLPTSVPNTKSNSDQGYSCVSDELAVGLDAQVSLNDLLVVRAKPYTGSILGHISPAAIVTIINGPKCEGGVIWWKVTYEQLSGWAVENLLRLCPKEDECKPWD
jgi:hypothetical protein